MSTSHWPLFDLRLTTPRLELRPPTDDDFPALLAAIDAGLHDAAEMPFLMAWTDEPREVRERNSVQWWWRQRAECKPEQWSLPLAVFRDGRAIGMQDVEAKRFGDLREVESGSWLTQSEQGQGLGKEMRAAALHLAFAGLGAVIARSAAFTDNARSLGVSRAMGYRENGLSRFVVRGAPKESLALEITREEWDARRDRLAPVQLSGLEPCLPMLGAG